MRHAEASMEGQSDLARSLNERGAYAVRSMGEVLARRDLVLHKIVCSHAARALQTAAIFKECAFTEIGIVADERIYDADPQRLLEIAAGFADEFESVMMVGHNPGFETFITLLTGVSLSMRPGSVVVIDIETERWQDVGPGIGNLTDTLDPVNHR
jgi:phosphohistidine phosphatase